MGRVVLGALVPLMFALGAAGAIGTAPAFAAEGTGQPTTPERVTIAIGGAGNILYMPLYVAKALGYFDEQGLAVAFEHFTGGTQAATALIAGSVDFTGNSLDQAIKAQVQGKPLTMIAAFTDVPGAQILVRSDLRDAVREPRDLAGRPVGVTGFASGSHMTLQHVLAQHGVTGDAVKALPIGFESLAAALENRRIDAMVGVGVAAARLIATGRAYVLVDLTARAPTERHFGGPYLNTGLVTRPEVCARRAKTCARLVGAVVKANQWIAKHEPGAIAAAFPPEVAGADPQLLAKAIEGSRDGFSRDGRMLRRAVETVVAAHRSFGGLAGEQPVDVDALVDNRFVDQALAAGS